MIAVAFTGPTQLNRRQKDFVRKHTEILLQNGIIGEYRTGAAVGVDTIVATTVAFNGKVRNLIYLPDASFNLGVQQLPGAEFRACGGFDQRPPAEAYRYRNEKMVLGRDDEPPASALSAFVYKPDFYRSGEWMTINIARKADIPVDLLVLPS